MDGFIPLDIRELFVLLQIEEYKNCIAYILFGMIIILGVLITFLYFGRLCLDCTLNNCRYIALSTLGRLFEGLDWIDIDCYFYCTAPDDGYGFYIG